MHIYRANFEKNFRKLIFFNFLITFEKNLKKLLVKIFEKIIFAKIFGRLKKLKYFAKIFENSWKI